MCPSGTGLGNEHFLRYVFVLDIYCQQLWTVVQLGFVFVPFGYRVGECIIYIVYFTVSGVVNVAFQEGGGEC